VQTLDRVDEVDWSSLRGVDGPATEVPDLLRALPSGDTDALLGELYNTVCNQGTRFEAAAHVVPFLVGLCVDPANAGRDHILWVVADLAIGEDAAWLPDGFPVAAERAELARPHAAPRHTAGSGFRTPALMAHAMRAYDAVRAEIPVIADLLDDPDPAVRTVAAYALAWFPEDAAMLVPRLLARLDREPVANARAAALLALGLLGDDRAAAERHLDHPERAVRLAAAIASGGRPGVLRAAVRDRFDEGEPRIPFLGGLANYAERVLTARRSSPPRARPGP